MHFVLSCNRLVQLGNLSQYPTHSHYHTYTENITNNLYKIQYNLPVHYFIGQIHRLNTRCGHPALRFSQPLHRLKLLIYADFRYPAAKYMHSKLLAVRTADVKAAKMCFMFIYEQTEGDASLNSLLALCFRRHYQNTSCMQ